MRVIPFLLVVAVAVASPVAFAQSTYKSWQNPDAEPSAKAADARLKEFVERLSEMVDKAEQARAADPVFLRDLRDLARDFERPWRRLVLDDAFLDGNFDANPTWRVAAGEYWVEKGWGLRSAVAPRTREAPTEPGRRSGEDAAAQLFGQILNQALGGNRASGQQPAAGPAEATIHVEAQISNAFALQADFSSWTGEGRFELALYQGKMTSAPGIIGYRVAYLPGGRMEFLRVSPRGSVIMESVQLASPLEDKNTHSLEWLRHRDGRMIVNVDGQQVMKVTDRGFRDPFNGLALINQGGDYIVKRVTLNGAS